jgi:signal peptidase II
MSFEYKKIAIYLILAIFFVSIDRFLKILALNYYQHNEISLIGEYLKFNFVENYNIAFSLPLNSIVIESIIPIIIVLLLYSVLKLAKNRKYYEVGYLTILLFGSISNYMDRLKFGFVVDYIDLKYFTVFNIADSMIVVAVVMLAYKTILQESDNKISYKQLK